MSRRSGASTARGGGDPLAEAFAALADMQAILDSLRAGALPAGWWLLARQAFADAAATGDPRLRRLYEQALDAIGGPPDGDLWDALPQQIGAPSNSG